MCIFQVLVLLTCITTISTVFLVFNDGYNEVPHELIASGTIAITINAGNIIHIGDNEFSAYANLYTIKLVDNPISFISDTAFSGTALRFLVLDGLQLTAMPNFSGVTTLEDLTINNAPMTTTPNMAFSGLTKLKSVKLYNLQLTAMPYFNGLSLDELAVYDTPMTTTPDNAFAGTTLTDVGLVRLQLTAMPNFNGTSLAILDVYDTPMTTTPDNAFAGTILTNVVLVRLQLTAMPYFNGTSLETLSVMNTPMTTTPGNAFAGTKLTKLTLDFVQLTDMPNLSGLPSLVTVSVSNSPVTTISHTAFSGTGIETLKLNFLQLTEIPNLSSVESTLKQLFLRQNPFVNYNFSTFSVAEILEYLYLELKPSTSMTDFPDLPMQLRSSSNFKILVVISNAMKDITGDRLLGYQLDTLDLRTPLVYSFPSSYPCEIFNASKTLTLNQGRGMGKFGQFVLQQHYSSFRKCFCQRDNLRLEVLNANPRSSSFDDMSNIFCNSVQANEIIIKTRELETDCACSNVWMAHLYTHCNVIYKDHYGQSACKKPLAEWGSFNDTMQCPQDFVIMFKGYNFQSPYPIITSAQTLPTTIFKSCSAVVRGKYVWRVSSPAGDVHLRPGSHPEVRMFVEPTSIEPLFKSDVILPRNADPVFNTAPCAPNPLHYPDLLGDRDIDTCYRITNQSSQEFTFLHRQSETEPMFVYVMTKDLDCRHPFFVEVFMERDKVRKCHSGRNPIQCAMIKSHVHPGDVTSCLFKCECSDAECRMDNKFILFVSDTDIGYLCEVVIRMDYKIGTYNNGWW